VLVPANPDTLGFRPGKPLCSENTGCCRGQLSAVYDPHFLGQMFNLVVRPGYVVSNRETTDRLLRALLKAESFAETHPDQAIDIVVLASGVGANVLRYQCPPTSGQRR
jgi:hypothetical protein